jgi:hypothetical protein
MPLWITPHMSQTNASAPAASGAIDATIGIGVADDVFSFMTAD